MDDKEFELPQDLLDTLFKDFEEHNEPSVQIHMNRIFPPEEHHLAPYISADLFNKLEATRAKGVDVTLPEDICKCELTGAKDALSSLLIEMMTGRFPGLICTRPAGHPGAHVAHGWIGEVAGAWLEDVELAPENLEEYLDAPDHS